jgi:hypothetical protein
MNYLMSFFKGLKIGFKNFGDLIALLVNTSLLFVAYILGIGFTFLFAKILGKRFLDLKPSKKANTYWSDLNLSKKPIDEYYRQF